MARFTVHGQRGLQAFSVAMACAHPFFAQVLRSLGGFSVVWLAASVAAAEPPEFRIMPLNLSSSFPACAVFDVDGDGRLDVFSGGFWYQSPDWQRHFVREVEMIRGRYDDYSNLPWDVDGDGWTDVISCNYRSESIYWVRNPGQPGQAWTKWVAARPGPMETGRLVDVDGDGVLDLLPNGTQFAAWWKLARPASRIEAGLVADLWQRRDLPASLAGHGIGAGDINGDGRVDLVCSRGWLEQGPDGQWHYHGEFRLHRDASIPILVWDVDTDGDADLVWGRGHHFGLYWLEQIRTDSGAREWQMHVVDSTWSQAHALITGDFDGDGRPELVSGSRYLGHDGRDLGEYDPLVVAWYRFEPSTRAWLRRYIHRGGRVALGLDPKTADLDGDGDLDLVLADRCGLYIAWNERTSSLTEPAKSRPVDQPPAEAEPQVDHRDPLVWVMGAERRTIETLEQWGERRDRILRDMQLVMGALPEPIQRVPLGVELLAEEDAGPYWRRTIEFRSDATSRVPAYLLVPKERSGPSPGVLCLHQTTSIGKKEPAGLGGNPNLHYADELARRGYVCLVPDYPSFGDYAFDFRQARGSYPSGTIKAIWDNMRAVDLLESLPEVDPDRIAVIGHSLGGHNALFTAAFDQRIRAVVTSCGFTAFHHYYGGNLAGWTSDRYMPRIAAEYGNDPDRVPFDFYEVLAAIAPRAVFVNAPIHDSNFAVEGVQKIEQKCRQVYGLWNQPPPRFVYPDCGHDFPPEVRQEVYDWLDKVLR
ncbi:MAG: hypothetical protein KatS3mg110_2238 [Pirellulaceae bacterium]|nr:MAG: hypothetical protein KatS3mg110_2238 [Pirellulaceae bacterium]